MQHITKCPWCRSEFMNISSANCSNCGGTIEYQKNTGDAGPKPSPAPRELPKKFVKRIKYTGNVMTIIGMVFTIPLFPTIIFPIIGIIIWKKGIKEANDELIPLQNGAVVMGEISEIIHDTTKVINNQSPYTVHFLFTVGGNKYSGNVGNIFTRRELLKQPGEKVWVVYMPENPELSSLWPPLV
jgi:hypothetical protein